MKLLNKLFFVMIFLPWMTQAQTSTPPSGSGTSGDPYQISSLDNLYWIAQTSSSWSSSFIQTQTIDASATSGWSGGGWTPIGRKSIPFNGTYNGQGYTISGLYINRSTTDSTGLFNSIGNSGTVKNLGLTSVSITHTSGLYTGSVAGYNKGVIDNCYSTGSISGTGDVGGLVGMQYTGNITNSYSTASVTGSAYYVGGIAGYWDSFTGVMDKCYFAGTITVSGSNRNIGGLVGCVNTCNINNCYSTGNVNADATYASYVGGVVGFSESGQTAKCKFTNCYSTGHVGGYTANGGFAGSTVTITNCFWDTVTSGKSVSYGGGEVGKSTAQMKTSSTFFIAGWSNTIWNIDAGTNNGYPYLDWQNPGGTPLPVEMTSISASIGQHSTHLTWSTATEVNNYGFEVERRAVTSGGLPVISWKKIGFIAGNGTSNAPHEYSFSDAKLTAGTYAYRLKQVDNGGAFKYSQETEVTIAVPQTFTLGQNFPNPFNPATCISYDIATVSNVRLAIYDMLGREVALLVNEQKVPGSYIAEFNGARYSSGIYFYTLQAGQYSETKRLILMK